MVTDWSLITGMIMKKSVFYLIPAAIFLAFMVLAEAQGAQMYKWTDENGVVHFSETPPPNGGQAEVSGIPADPGGAGPESAAAGSQPAAVSPAQQRRDEMAERRKVSQAEAAVREVECESKRSIVTQLEPHRRVYFTNDEGETERMDDQVRVDKVAEAKKFIQENCN